MTNSQLNETILTLYRGSRDIPSSNFKEWAMETVRGAVAFDSGIWFTSDVISDDFSSMYLFQQPRGMIENYNMTMRLSGDFLAHAATLNMGRTINLRDIIDREEFVRLPTYSSHCHRYGMEHALCTWLVTNIVQIPSGISFFRATPDAPFTETDRETKEFLVPHMIEAMRINLFSFLQDADTKQGEAKAICDSMGMFYETTPAFPVVMRSAQPDWTGPRLALPGERLDGQEKTRWLAGGLKFEAVPCRDLFLVKVAPQNQLDRLSPRQLAVAEMLAMGKRYKDIARELDISPSTVTNHVNQIHARLEIDRREDLIRLFNDGTGKSLPR